MAGYSFIIMFESVLLCWSIVRFIVMSFVLFPVRCTKGEPNETLNLLIF